MFWSTQKSIQSSRTIRTKAQAQSNSKHLSLHFFFVHSLPFSAAASFIRSSFSLFFHFHSNACWATQSKSIKSEWSDVLLSRIFVVWKKAHHKQKFPRPRHDAEIESVFWFALFFPLCGITLRWFRELFDGHAANKNKWIAICKHSWRLWQAKQLKEINAHASVLVKLSTRVIHSRKLDSFCSYAMAQKTL